MKKRIAIFLFVLSFVLLAIPAISAASDAVQQLPSLELTTAAGYLSWSSDFVCSRAELRLFGPEGFVHNAELGDGTPMVSLAELEDGAYRWSLLLVAEPSADDRSSLEKGLAVETVAHRFTGEFTISESSVRFENESGAQGSAQGVEKTQVYIEDVIVIGDQCVGSGCEITETIAPDTLRLKNNSIRLHFDDTSTATNHPANDWRITINDAIVNGGNYFSIDDATASSQVLRLDAGAPANALRIVADGDVGLGTDTPGASLHVQRSDGTASLEVRETNATVADRTLLELTNNGGSKIQMVDTSAGGETWFIQNDANSNGLNLSQLGSGGVEVQINTRQDADGVGAFPTLVVDGSIKATNISSTSTREKKAGFQPVDTQDVLGRLSGIEIQTWHYKSQDASIQHMGPMAEDFSAVFGLGVDDTTIYSTDVNGVALAAIQGLHELVKGLQAQNVDLRVQNAELKQRLDAIESSFE